MLSILSDGILSVTLGNIIMMLVALGLIYLAIAKKYEPALLVPIGFSTILANIPLSSAVDQFIDGVLHKGVLNVFFDVGIVTEIFPLLIFIAVGAMIDFGPLLEIPSCFYSVQLLNLVYLQPLLLQLCLGLT